MSAATAVALSARSYLFVPGNRPDRFEKARASGADVVILDLEDAVAPADKPAARLSVENWLRAAAGRVAIALRINAANTEWFAGDLALCRQPGVAAVLLPKAERLEDLARTAAGLAAGAALIPIIESAIGMRDAEHLAAAGAVQRLAFGTLDFAVDLGLSIDDEGAQDELASFRSHLVLVSRVAQLQAPIDGVTTAFSDETRLDADVRRARRFGFGAKLCIHPRQIAAVHLGFAPTPSQREWAERVLAAIAGSAGAAVQVDGVMVDRPVVLQAEAIIAQAKRKTP